MSYETILYEEDGPIGTITLNRPEDGNMFNATMCHEIRDCIEQRRQETHTRVLVLTGAGDRFFCIGGRKDGLPDTQMYPGILPTLEMYEATRSAVEDALAKTPQKARGSLSVAKFRHIAERIWCRD